MGSAAEARADAARLAKALDGLWRHIEIPSGLSALAALMLAMLARRHATDVTDLKVPPWFEVVQQA